MKCDKCGESYKTKKSLSAHERKHCDTTEDRFWIKVDESGEDDCWEWKGCKHEHGYGQFRYNGSTINAHRYSLILKTGEEKNDKYALHKCHNPPCVNPEHLFWGTQSENIKQSFEENGNSHVGENNKKSHLTEDEVRKIYYDAKTTDKNNRQIGNKYGTSRDNVSNIENRHTWSHLDLEDWLINELQSELEQVKEERDELQKKLDEIKKHLRC